jgi:hypothetical protein
MNLVVCGSDKMVPLISGSVIYISEASIRHLQSAYWQLGGCVDKRTLSFVVSEA